MVHRLFVVCNALDDHTRLSRGIATDSPAASRKVFGMCRAVRLAGIRPIVLSLGRGRPDGSGRFFRTSVRRIDGVPVIYAAFSHRALLSQLVSLLSPAILLWRARRLAGDKVIVFYNRMPAYVPALVLASLLHLRTVLDLEDGEVHGQIRSLSGAATRLVRGLFDRLCSGGALLACRALAAMTTVRPVACYYGTVEPEDAPGRWPAAGPTVLMCGTVSADTGAGLLIDAIEILRSQRPSWAEGLNFQVTGKGDSIETLQKLAKHPGWPSVTVHGRTTDAQYREIVASAQVGLALKPRTGPLAHTTFPSKVIELAGAGLLLLSTDISDVRSIFASAAVYLEDESAAGLVECLQWIAENQEAAHAISSRGMQTVHERFDPLLAGGSLARFLFSANP